MEFKALMQSNYSQALNKHLSYILSFLLFASPTFQPPYFYVCEFINEPIVLLIDIIFE